MKTILVPTDFSKAARTAADVACGIAAKTGAKLVLLHVTEGFSGGSFNVEGEVASTKDWGDRFITMKIIEKAREQLMKLTNELSGKRVDVTSLLRMGTAYHGMHTIIIERRVDLIVMGTQGASGIDEFMLGSNTAKIVRRAHCPVLSISRKPSQQEFKTVVYATSLREDEEMFARFVRKTQEIYDSTIHMVHINTPGMFLDDTIVKEKMKAFAKKRRLEKCNLHVFNDFSPEAGILHFADSVNADMIAMATHGRKGLAHVLDGSIAERVVNHSHRPVLTFVVGRSVKKK